MISLDRVDAARDARDEREQLRNEARYRRERLELYRARLYGGRAVSQSKLRELQRASYRRGCPTRAGRGEPTAHRSPDWRRIDEDAGSPTPPPLSWFEA
jgi:hypothetical protein